MMAPLSIAQMVDELNGKKSVPQPVNYRWCRRGVRNDQRVGGCTSTSNET
jgi:hypothetical protein